MSSPDELQRLFDESVESFASSNREQLSYRQMIILADVFEGWAMDKKTSPEWSAKILGWAEGMRCLSEEVGPDWNPPEPVRLNLLGFLARKVLEE